MTPLARHIAVTTPLICVVLLATASRTEPPQLPIHSNRLRCLPVLLRC